MKRAPTTRRDFRSLLVIAVFGVAALLLGWRAVFLQTAQHERLQRYSERISVRNVVVPAHRGMIVDRNGEPLAMSTPVASVWAEPRVLLNAADGLTRLAPILDLTADQLGDKLKPRIRRDFVYLKRQVPPAVADAVRNAGVPGVHLEQEYKRFYPTGEVTSHLLGFTNVDDQGQEGVERAFDRVLTGASGKKRVVRDQRGRTIEYLEEVQPVRPGQDLMLSIDRRLQYICYRELKAAVKRHEATSGSMVLLDVASGEVLALVNQPAFNPNNRSALRGEFYRNRASTDIFEPGSTMKPFTVAAALESGLYAPDTMINTAPGYYQVGNDPVRDHRNYGRISVADVIRYSSNVGSSKMALAMEGEALWQRYRSFGFGSATGTGLPGEAAGRLNHHSNWSEIDQATLAFGYGIATSSLQLARAYLSIARDGEVTDLSVVRGLPRETPTRAMSADTARAVRRMLMTVVEDGTGKAARVPGYSVAGKTGTAHKTESGGGYAEDRYRSLFAGMIPAEAPRLVAVVVIEDPRAGGYFGGAVAAPVFAGVMREAVRLLGIPPDRPDELGGAQRLAGRDAS